MEREDHVSLRKVETTCKKHKNEDPLPFLRKPSTIRPSKYGSEVDIQPTGKRPTPSGLMDMIFQQEAQDEMDLTIAFFSISTSLIQCCIVTSFY